MNHERSNFALDCMAEIRQMLAHPKPAGNWWARQVMARVAAGENVGINAYDLAKRALEPRIIIERQPGEDWEEDDEQPV